MPGLSVLVILEAGEIYDTARKQLTQNQYQNNYRIADSVMEAFRVLHHDAIDIILVQANLAVEDILKQYPFIPCIALGSRSEQNRLETLLKLGASDYMFTDLSDWYTMIDTNIYRIWNIRNSLQQELLFASQRYHNLVEALPDIVYELDPQGHFTFVNQAVRSLGYEPEELLGKHFSTILFEEDIPQVSRDNILKLYKDNTTGDRFAPKLFDERRSVERKTENLELRIKRKSIRPGFIMEEMYASIISYGEVSSAGTYQFINGSSQRIFIGTVGIIRDITLRRKSEEMLRKMYQAVDQSPAGILIININLLIEYVNPAFFSMTGSGPEQVIGNKFLEYFANTSDQNTYEDLLSSLQAGIDWKGEICCHKMNGDPFWSSLTISAIRNPNGSLTHYLCIIEDISRRKTLDELLKNAKEAAEAANKAKSEFLANMGHEIRTPLAGIIALTEVLLTDNPRSDQYDRIKAIQSSSQSLLAILNDLLDLSKIEARAIEFYRENFDLNETITTLLLPYKAQAEEKGITFQYSIDDGGFPTIYADRIKINRIISNLVSNAIKFTETGQVSIHCVIRAKDNTPGLFVTVKDTGVGISGMDQQRLFKHFTQLHSKLSKKHHGTGLGLAISKELAVKMGGDITFDSIPGQGSTFYFYTPVGVATGKPFEVDEFNYIAKKRLSILIAEDNPVNRDYLHYFIKKAGHMVEVAEDGLVAIQKLEKGDFDLILMDLQMPGMDGISAASTIRSYKGINYDPQIPIIALTAYTEPELAVHEQKLSDFDAYVSKPINATSLLSLIDTIMTKKEYFDINRLKQHYVSSKDEFKRLLLIASQDLPKHMEQFITYHEQGNYTDAAEYLHGLVSIFSAIGSIRGLQLIKRYRRTVQDQNYEALEEDARDIQRETLGIRRQIQQTLGEL
ncbi:PAS domain S-box protein [Gracilinema caldarium]|uniref:Sensory/regulatory protein RpfC n=1 Tax=Gracilinema caldarium (strain ATCC 51460 / DSM 7334 / H1) TaxID=744872 RepID=F8EYD4_GRAC1|nr:PAS domain S-box protein [Gracilinema caldarium]AEJ18366.1 PAS/PAC sensor hybrid histidine kinase [Gracilinema caldarium DSM 7334]